MDKLHLKSNEIITLNNYPVYSFDILNNYILKCESNISLDFIPIVSKDLVKPFLEKDVLAEFKKFEKLHPNAKYFMLDGSHRTTALTVTHKPIFSISYESSKDIVESKKLVSRLILKEDPLTLSLEKNCEILNAHFRRKPYFMTVLEKTEKMFEDGYIKK